MTDAAKIALSYELNKCRFGLLGIEDKIKRAQTEIAEQKPLLEQARRIEAELCEALILLEKRKP